MTTSEHSEPGQPLAVPLSDQLGPALEAAAYYCMSELAGVDTYDVSLRDHPQAWAAIEAFAAKVKAAERERCAEPLRRLCARLASLLDEDQWAECEALLLEAVAGPNAELRGRP